MVNSHGLAMLMQAAGASPVSDAPNDKLLHRFACAQCGATVISCEPPKKMTVHENKRAAINLLCIGCDDEVLWGKWPERWGPYPWRVTHHRSCEAGHA